MPATLKNIVFFSIHNFIVAQTMQIRHFAIGELDNS